jgi:multicomponent Na+:H+ antiporter subunit D
VISQHLIVLVVVVPLIASTLIAAVRKPTFAWAMTLAVSLIELLIAWQLLQKTLAEKVISYPIGSWAPPLGIEYRVDALNAFVVMLIALIGAVVAIYAKQSVEREIAEESRSWYYALYLLCYTGLIGMAVTGDAFNVFVFMEIASLSSYVLIALGRNRRALYAAYQYLIIGTVGATFFVIGIGFLYLMTGTLNLADLAARLPNAAAKGPVYVGLAFITVGLCLKLALFPLHLWLPNAYAFAPSVTTIFLAATATKVAIYLLLRFTFVVFGPSMAFHDLAFPAIWIALSIAGIFYGSIAAMFQDNVKRAFAYSSVAQIGYITLGIGIASQTGLTGAVVHLFNHGIMKAALFMLAGTIALRAGAVMMNDLPGLARRAPLTAIGIVIAGLSMVGVPGTVGFVSKWYLVLASFEKGWWWLAALIVASSILSLAYMWRIVEAIYAKPEPKRQEKNGEAPLSMLLPSAGMVVACVYFGIDTRLPVSVAAIAAELLLGASR